jgi:N-acetylglucosaminyldiphosphoundecaprenol N-acetyl-beta-D-mannosaminyltransferase
MPLSAQELDADLLDRREESASVESEEIWGLRLARLSYQGALDRVDYLVRQGRLPGRGRSRFFITANLHYAMLTDRDPRLKEVNDRADFILADGMPMVWYSRLAGRPLPERVAGSDLIYRLAEQAARRGHSLFLLGGGPGVAEAAAETLRALNPGLAIAGIESPMLGEMSPGEHGALIERIRRSGADVLLVAFGQPKGELWLAQNCEALGVPVSVQLGASFDFVAGRVRRAPRWVQRIGAEWLYRITREPRRMIPRYTADAVFLVKSVLYDAVGRLARRVRRDAPYSSSPS